ncbi:PLP-dependent aminotransferase family protein, partial [Actinomadura adrarensis]
PRPDATAFAQVALRHGVEVVPGAAMDPDGRDDSHLRLPFTYPPEMLSELVDRLATAWARFDHRTSHAEPRTHPDV